MAQLGMVGLGRMGANIVRRLMRDGHDCVVYNRTPEPIKQLAGEGAVPTFSLKELAEKLDAPRAVWVMVPAGEITEQVVHDVADVLESGDAIIDGGNSYYRDDIRRAAELAERGIDYIDCGTSGGVFGLRARLLPDDRRAGCRGRAPRPDLRLGRPGSRRRASGPRAAAANRAPPRTAICTAARAGRATS